MSTATFLTTVSRKHRVQVDFDVQHKYTTPYEGITVNADGVYVVDGKTYTQTKEQRIAWLIARCEDSMKSDWPEWLLQDGSRGVTIESQILRAENPQGDGWDLYDCVISWPVHATARLIIEVDSALYPEEAGDLFQQCADAAADQWLAGRPFTPLP